MDCDLIKFWSNIPDNAFIHPADNAVFERTSHQLRTDCLPISFFGPICSAPIVLLYLSPGYTEFDSEHSSKLEARDFYKAQRTGKANLPTELEHRLVYRWWRQRVGQFAKNPDNLVNKVAILNIGAYRSKKFDDFHMLSALPSSRVSMNFAHSVLFPQAEAGERIVICMRSHRFWGLGIGKHYGKALFAPSTTPSGYMHNGEMRENIISAVQTMVRGA